MRSGPRSIEIDAVVMKMKKAIVILLLLATMPLALAEEEVHTIDDPVDDDLMLSGDTIVINARVDGDVFLTAGTVEINAPITGDAFVAGGTITLDGEIGGDVIAGGSQVKINQNVGGKVIALGGTVNLDAETAEKVILVGGTVRLGTSSVVGGKAYVVGGQVVHAGDVEDTLSVRAGIFRNSGTAGELDHQATGITGLGVEDLSALMGFATFIAFVLAILVFLGFLVLGILFLRYFPQQFLAVEEEVRRSPLRNALMGLVLILATAVLLVILAITIIGIPTALVLGLLSIIALLTSWMFVSLALGRWVGARLNLKISDTWLFVIGWVILCVLSNIPLVGWVIAVVAICLGYGSIFYALRGNWGALTGRSVQTTAA